VRADPGCLGLGAQKDVATCSWQRPITIRDLLTFTAGFSYSFDFPSDEQGPLEFPEFSPLNVLQLSTYNLEQWADTLASQPLAAQPGEMFYYGWCMDVSQGAPGGVSRGRTGMHRAWICLASPAY
jgi:hypothetical protein